MKQLIFCYVCLKVLIKTITSIFLVVTDSSQLPSVVFGVSTVIILVGALVAARYYTGRAKTNEIAMFFFAEVAATIFSLLFVNSASLAEIGMLDIVITGSLLDVIVAVVVIFTLLFLRSKVGYANMGKQTFSHQNTEVSGKPN